MKSSVSIVLSLNAFFSVLTAFYTDSATAASPDECGALFTSGVVQDHSMKVREGDRQIGPRQSSLVPPHIAIDPKSGHRAELIRFEPATSNSATSSFYRESEKVVIHEADRSNGSSFEVQPHQRLGPVTESRSQDVDSSYRRRRNGRRVSEVTIPGAQTLVATPKKEVFLVGTKTGGLYLVRFGNDRASFENLNSSRVLREEIARPRPMADGSSADGIAELSFVARDPMATRPLPVLRVIRADGRVQVYELTLDQWGQILEFGR